MAGTAKRTKVEDGSEAAEIEKSKRASKVAKAVQVVIEETNLAFMDVELESDSLLCTHRFDEKNAHMILAKQQKMTLAREKRDPEAEFRASMYLLPPGPDGEERYGFPAGGLREAMATAAKRFHGIHKVQVYGSLWIDGELSLPGNHPKFGSLGPRSCVEIKGEVLSRVDIVQLAGMKRVADLRFRAYWKTWKIPVRIKYDADRFSPETIVRLLHSAGTRVGIGEYRAEKGGDWGAFHPTDIQTSSIAA